ncbi:MAG: cytochrome P450, partial [Polyangiaceae bacterium]
MPTPFLPPGPEGHPMVNMARWLRDPFRFLDLARAQYGDTFTMRIGVLTAVIVSEPDAVKQVFALGPDEGHAGEANFILKAFLGPSSLLLLDGAPHQRHRKMMQPAFHGERMNAYGRTMIDLASASIDRWPVGETFAVHKPLQSVTLDVIIRTVFGVEDGPRFVRLAELLKGVLDAGASPMLLFPFLQRNLGPLTPWARLMKAGEASSEILREEIRAGRGRGTAGRTDVLAMMLDARDESGQPLSEDEVHDELVTLLLAGHETTATSLAWALRWILPDPALIARLREEIATAGGEPERIVKLPLLDATVKESLRLQPIVPVVARVLKQPMRIGGVDFAAQTIVAPSVYLVHQRPSLYPDPTRFHPDRFLSFKPSTSEWIPFGGGLRRCIGAAFAVYEMKMVLATLLPRVDARLAQDGVRVVR